MILQLDPMLPVFVPRFKMEGYAFLVHKQSQEDYTIFTVALDNGEIWDLSNRELRFCVNHTVGRSTINKKDSIFKDAFKSPDSSISETKI